MSEEQIPDPPVTRTDSRDDRVVALDLRGVTRSFGEGDASITAVSDVNLRVYQGEIVLIMGPSGSGKTTLLTMMAGLLRPTSGRISVFGQDITEMPESKRSEIRRKFIGFVFQSFNLLTSLSAMQNVMVSLNLAGVGGKQATNRATAMLEQVGLRERMHFRPETLSGGERQRVSIARALANDAPLILADEPTASLDSKNGHEVVGLLRSLAKTDGRTIVIVSHDVRIRPVADRVLWLEDGHLSDQELPHSEVSFDDAPKPRPSRSVRRPRR